MFKFFMFIMSFVFINSLYAEYWLNSGNQGQNLDPYTAQYIQYMNQQAAMYNAQTNAGANVQINKYKAQGAIQDSAYAAQNMVQSNQALRQVQNKYDIATQNTIGEAQVNQAAIVGAAQTKQITKCWNGRCGLEYQRQMGDNARTATNINKINNAKATYGAYQGMQRDMTNDKMKTVKFNTDSYYDYNMYLQQKNRQLNYDPLMPIQY